jgi:hypothetical protein
VDLLQTLVEAYRRALAENKGEALSGPGGGVCGETGGAGRGAGGGGLLGVSCHGLVLLSDL